MKEILIADVHANKQALDAVMEDISSIDYRRIICLGDVLGYGADPAYCYELISKKAEFIIMGNHEAGICEILPLGVFSDHAKKAIVYQRTLLTPNTFTELKKLPGMLQQPPFLFIHGSVIEQYAYMFDAEDFRENSFVFKKKYPGYKVCVFAHTHEQVYFKDGKIVYTEPDEKLDLISEQPIYLNPGSVGQPRGGHGTMARYAILDREEMSVYFKSIEYDFASASKAIEEAELPKYLADRLKQGV